MVEIGGEIATSGVNNQQQPWQIAIDAPIEDSTVSERQTISAIRQPINTDNQMHLATSGNYRNSVIFDGSAIVIRLIQRLASQLLAVHHR